MSDTARSRKTTKDEKLSALAALIGPDALGRLREGGLPEITDRGAEAPSADLPPDRIAWHQNRLLQRLRARLESPDRQAAANGRGPDATNQKPDDRADRPPARTAPELALPRPSMPLDRGDRRIDGRIADAFDAARLPDEHPAVIAHLLQRLDRPTRVKTLRSLPGQTARAVVRRMRDG